MKRRNKIHLNVFIDGNTTFHELKTDSVLFFEIRKDDRDFKVDDILTLRETKYSAEEMKNGKPLIYTGRKIDCRVKYIMHGPNQGWVIMGLHE